MKVFKSWRELMLELNAMGEEEVRESLNFEVSMYKRKRFIERMHMRYEALRSKRERDDLVNGRTLL